MMPHQMSSVRGGSVITRRGGNLTEAVMSCSHLLNTLEFSSTSCLAVLCVYIHIYIYICRYIYIYVYMYHCPPQTLHLFSSQIKQSCHTFALLGPAKICQEGLLNAVMLNLRFIHPPRPKKETGRFGGISRILEVLGSPSPKHIKSP